MANTNFIVHNGLSIGPVTVDAATGDMTGVANLVITGSANISSIQNGNSNVRVIANANVTISSTGVANVLTITSTGVVAGLLDIDNIRLDGNTISSTNTNGNINLSPNGTGNVIVNDALIPGANATYTLGNTGAYWSTIYGTATTALYADLAENYTADAEYEPGTVVSFGGSKEIMRTDADMDPRVAGVVSTNPAHLMNGELKSQYVAAIALTGRVPTKVIGPVRKGDLMVSTVDGRARSEIAPVIGSVIGKSLEHFDGDDGVIEVVIGRV